MTMMDFRPILSVSRASAGFLRIKSFRKSSFYEFLIKRYGISCMGKTKVSHMDNTRMLNSKGTKKSGMSSVI